MSRLNNRRAMVLAIMLATWLVPVTAQGADTAPAPVASDPALTDGRTFAHWAHSLERAAIRRQPALAAPLVARLRLDTEDGYPEVYPLLEARIDAGGRRWLRVGIPGRPNGRTGWVLDSSLGPAYLVRTRLLVDRGRLRATLTRGGRSIWTARIGVGAASTPTPPGSFWIREKLRVTPGSSYGPRAFGTSDYSTLTDWPGGGVIGIHGTDQPGLIPGRPSHGCVRLRNADILRLFELMPIGTPVVVV
ncbi:MAG: ErfK/YbiS/YcfS/YnhG family protein [Thermoleophilia bacterium]|nr:ErfK/YbiS/YcfS/YnhG family protein [Thermoleophilia bacterium]